MSDGGEFWNQPADKLLAWWCSDVTQAMRRFIEAEIGGNQRYSEFAPDEKQRIWRAGACRAWRDMLGLIDTIPRKGEGKEEWESRIREIKESLKGNGK